ncbi:MAG: carboxypeptidase-like regulatory domain-containing protein [Bacteroidota bacterium]
MTLSRWSLLLVVCGLCAVQAQAQVVEGYVLDAETGAPLAGVNVAVVGSLRGAATNVDGYFRIAPFPLGSHELIASSLGYAAQSYPIRLLEARTYAFEIRLEPSAVALPTITVGTEAVSPEEARTRQRHVKSFERFFFGPSGNAKHCTLLNPEVLVFSADEERGVLSAHADHPLLVENRALGYQIEFLLDEFSVVDKGRNRTIRYRGKSHFVELEPEGDREARRWTRNRERAYRGSPRHFLTALVQDRLWQEGFMFIREGADLSSRYAGVTGGRPGQRVFAVEPAEVLQAGDLPFERRLGFEGSLKVIYGREGPSSAYLKYARYSSRGLRSDGRQQESWIALNQPSITVTTDGHVADAFALTRFGYWYFERVAEMLPREYQPSGELGTQVPGLLAAAASAEAAPPDPESLIATGLTRLQATPSGTPPPDAALEALADAFRADPGYRSPQHGAAAFWFGQALAQRGDVGQALSVWQRGLSALADRDQFEARLADLYVRTAFRTQRQDHYAAAGEAYVRLLDRPLSSLPDSVTAATGQHLAQLIFLLGPDDQAQLLDGRLDARRLRYAWTDSAGVHAARWWRSQDPLPGSPENERVVEHLTRVAQAEDLYTFARSPVGFDLRGEVFVRYGPPITKSIVRTDLNSAAQILRENGMPLPGPLIAPPNEFWAYRPIDERLYYLFALKEGRYQEVTPEDLIPDDLQRASQRTGRMPRGATTLTSHPDVVLATALMEARRSLYAELARMHPDFEENLEAIETADADLRATMHIARDQFNNSDPNGGPVAVSTGQVQGMGAQFQNRALQASRTRDDRAPDVASAVLSTVEPLPVAFRSARFLNEDGTTRVELYWSHIPGTLALNRRLRQAVLGGDQGVPDRYLMTLTATLRGPDYEPGASSQLRYLARDLPRGAGAPVQRFSLDSLDALTHLAVQWEQALADVQDGETVASGQALRTGVQRRDSLTALANNPARLEMSDLKPLFLSAEQLAALDEGASDQVYPFLTVTPETELGLAFEVYHLAYDANDQTRYTVSYEVVRGEGRRRQDRIAATTLYQGSVRTAEERIALDLTDYDRDGPLAITVRVTDEVTGQTVARTLRFRLTTP